MKVDFKLNVETFKNEKIFATVVQGFFPNIEPQKIERGFIDFFFDDKILNIAYVSNMGIIEGQKKFFNERERGVY